MEAKSILFYALAANGMALDESNHIIAKTITIQPNLQKLPCLNSPANTELLSTGINGQYPQPSHRRLTILPVTAGAPICDSSKFQSYK